MQESSKKVVSEILNQIKPPTILDAPCGRGWLQQRLSYAPLIDGVDLFESHPFGYAHHFQHDLDLGLPKIHKQYDAIVSCEGIEHFGNPQLFFKSSYELLAPGGLLLITTPNIWYPEARLQFWLKGFFPGFPPLIGRIERGTHMHIMPWSYAHLYLYLKLAGYQEIALHKEPLSRPKRWYAKILALPQKLYSKNKLKKGKTEEEKNFWRNTLSSSSLYGRHLIVTAKKPLH